jgi:hypothetical protein
VFIWVIFATAIAQGPKVPRPPDTGEIQPAPGAAALSRAELLWCLYREERIEGAKARLEKLTSQQDSTAQYNAAAGAYNDYIAPWNRSCVQRKYFMRDQDVVKAEVA